MGGAAENVIVVSGNIISPIKDTVYAIDVAGEFNTGSIGRSTIVESAIKFAGTDHILTLNKDKADSYMYKVEGGDAYDIIDDSKDNSKFVVKGSANSLSIADIKDTTHRLYERFGSVNSALATHYGEDQSRM